MDDHDQTESVITIDRNAHLLRRLGFPASDDTVVHHLKRRARLALEITAPFRVVGIDDWAWRNTNSLKH